MNRLHRMLAAALLPIALAAPVIAQDVADEADDPRFATGAVPIAPEDYRKLPKVVRFRAFLAPKVDLSDMFPPPSNQGSQPSCVAWASAYAARSYLYSRELGRRAESPVDILSPAYIYNSLREPGPRCSSAIPIQRALDFMKEGGVVSLSDYPYDEFKCGEPDKTLASKALRFRISDWRAIDRVGAESAYWDRPIALDDVKGALTRGAPVIFAMPVTSAFYDLKADAIYRTDVNIKKRYHAMAAVGYDEAKQAVRVINSWGTKWSDGGFGWIDYDTFKLLVGEAYALEPPVVKPAPPPAETPAQTFERLRAAMGCAGVTLSTVKGTPIVSGYAGDIKAMAELQAAASAAWPQAKWQVAHHPWPQCEADMTLAAALADSPVTIAALTQDGRPRGGDPVAMKAGERFGVTASTIAAKPYLSIIYLQADGSAVELYRGQPAPDRRKRLTASIGTSGGREHRFEVQEPLGNEVIIAVASAQPLFGPELKSYQTERQFLTALRGKLATAPKGSVSAAMLRVLTQ